MERHPIGNGRILFRDPVIASCTLELAPAILSVVDENVPEAKSVFEVWVIVSELVARDTPLLPSVTPIAAGLLAYCVVEVAGATMVAAVAPPDQSVWVKVEVVAACAVIYALPNTTMPIPPSTNDVLLIYFFIRKKVG